MIAREGLNTLRTLASPYWSGLERDVVALIPGYDPGVSSL